MIESVSSQLHARIKALVGISGAGASEPDISKSANTDSDKAALTSALKAVGYALPGITLSSAVAGAAQSGMDGTPAVIKTVTDANNLAIGRFDADLNGESANLKAQETKERLATQSLGITNGGSQNMPHLIDRLA